MNQTEPNPTSEQPRPSVPLVVLSLLVLGGCAVVAGFGVALPIVMEFPPAVVFSFLLLAVCLTISLNQFLGTFRRWPGSALAVGLVGLFVGTLWLIMLALAVFETFHMRPEIYHDRGEQVLLWVSVCIGLLLLWAGMANLLWHIRLKRSTGPSEPIPRWRFSFQELFLLMTVLAVGLASTGYQLRQMPPKWGENVELQRARYDLPASAQNICFSRAAGVFALEFTLDEAGFREWVSTGHPHDERWHALLEPISSTCEVPRYWKANRPPAQPTVVKVNQGLILQGNYGGSTLQVLFDQETGKVYLYETWFVNYDK